MLIAIGFLELNSIAAGVEAADFMIKAADVELVTCKTVCPGKYIILVAGEVADVHAAMAAGETAAANHIVDAIILPNVHPQVIQACAAAMEIQAYEAIGVLEFFSITSAIIGADAAVKKSSVDLVEVRLGLGIGGKSYFILTGDTASVREAVAAGSAEAKAKGLLFNEVVIPYPHPDLLLSLL